MLRPNRLPVRRALTLGAACLVATLSCGREVTGPGGVRIARGFSWVAEFAPGNPASAVASDLVPYTKVRVTLHREDGTTAVDRVVDFPSNVESVPVSLDIELSPGAPASGEAMDLTLKYINAAADTVFRGGPVPVTVAATRDGETPAPVELPVAYSGPGSEAVAVSISQAGLTVLSGDPFTFTAVAMDAGESPLATAPIAWRSLDLALATITNPATGAGVTLAGRGTARIVAQLLNGPADTVLLTVTPRASALTRVSGNDQQATVSTALSAPVVVRVMATDNLPMAGVTVSFAPTSGGSVGTPSMVTGTDGLAQSTWTLGAAEGVQTLTASSAGLIGSPLGFTATALPTGPDRLAFGTQPASATAGVAFTPAVTVRMEDANGQLRTGFVGAVTMEIGDNPGDEGLDGTLSVAAVGGIATFTDLSINTADAGYTLIASASGVSAVESTPFEVIAGPAAELNFDVHPTGSLVDEVITPAIVVRVMDTFGNHATAYVGNVSIDFANTTGAALSGTRSQAVVAGLATFDDLSINQSGTYSLAATAPGLTGATSDGFNVSDAGANALEWTNPAGGNWNVPANWSEGRVPTAGDSVVIALDGTYTVTLDLSPTVNALVIGGGSGTRTLSFPARQLTVNSTLAVLPNAGLEMTNGAVLGGGMLRNEGTITLRQGSLSIASVHNDGLIIARDASSVSGVLTTTALSVIRVLGASGTGTGVLHIANTFSNAGLIELSSIDGGFTATLNVTNGWLENLFGGTISSLVGAGGARNLNVRLVNRGTVSTPAALQIARASSSHSNELGGVINVTGGNLTVSQSGTNPSFVNLGAFNLTAGRTLSFTGGVLNSTSGSIDGLDATLALNNMTLLFTPEYTRTRLNMALVTMLDGITITALDTLRLVGGAVNTPIVNNGTILAQGTVAINNLITTNAGSKILVRGAPTFGTGALTIGGALENSAEIELTSVGGGFTSSLAVTGGLTNTATGTITSLVGAAGARTLAAELINEGTLSTPAALTLALANAAHVNSGLIDVTGANLTVTQTGVGAPSFSNLGTIALAAGRTLSITGGQINLQAGTLTGGTATLSTSNATLAFTTASARARLNLINTTVPGTFTIPAGDSIVLAAGSPTMTLVNDGTLISQGAVTFNGSLTANEGSTLRLRGASIYGTSDFTYAGGVLVNDGTVELTSIDGGFSALLTVPAGLVNTATGVIAPLAGAAGARTIAAQVDNQGVITTAAALTINRTDAAHVNSGTIDLTAANLTVTQTGVGAPSFTNTGLITMAAGRTLSVTGGQVNLDGGTLTGGTATLATANATLAFTTASARARLNLVNTTVPGTFTIPTGDSIVLVDGSPTMTLVNDGTLISQGAVTFNGSLTTNLNSTLRLRGASIYGTSAFNYPVGTLTNNGTIELTSIDGGFSSSLTVPGGLTNAASGTIVSVVGAAGARTIAAELDNQGAILLPAALTLARADAAHTSSGTIDITGGNLTVTQTGTAPSFANTGIITMSAGRTMGVTGGALVLTGGQMNGGTATLATNNTLLTFTTPEARTRLNLVATTVPGTFTIPPGDSLVLVDGSPTMTLVNAGRLISQGGVTFNGSITTATPTSLIMLRGASIYGNSAFTYNGTLTNTGVIDLTSIDGGFSSSLTTTGGFVNAPTGVINSVVGAAGARTVAAPLDNQGTINTPAALTLARVEADHVNSGSINVTGGDLTLTQTGTSPSFVNQPGGVIALSAGRTMGVTGGALDLTQGQLNGGAATLATNNVNLSFTVPTAVTRFNLTNTVIPHTVTVPAGDSLVLVGGAMNAPLVNNGLVLAQGANTLGGAITTGLGSTIRARGASIYGNAALTVTNGFTNTARIELTSINGGFASTFAVINGTLVNAAGGVIETQVGAAGARTLAAELDNQGTVTVDAQTTLSRANSAHSNSGTIDATGANLTVALSGAPATFTNTGTIDLVNRTLFISGGAFDFTAGLVSGPAGRLSASLATLSFTPATLVVPMAVSNTVTVPHTVTVPAGQLLHLVGGTLAAPIDNSGTVLVNASMTLTGAITTTPTSVIRVQGASIHGTATLNVTNTFANYGLLELTSVDGGFSSSLSITTGGLINNAGGTFNVLTGQGGTRTFTGQFINNMGTIAASRTWAANTTLEQRNIMNVSADATTVSGASSFFGGSVTTLSGTGALVKAGGCFNSGGTGNGSACP